MFSPSDRVVQHGQDHHAVGRELRQLDPEVEGAPGDDSDDNDDNDDDSDIIRRLSTASHSMRTAA